MDPKLVALIEHWKAGQPQYNLHNIIPKETTESFVNIIMSNDTYIRDVRAGLSALQLAWNVVEKEKVHFDRSGEFTGRYLTTEQLMSLISIMIHVPRGLGK
jgi:hypothetical protein